MFPRDGVIWRERVVSIRRECRNPLRTEQPESGGDAIRELKVGCGKPTGAKVGEKEQTELPGEEPKLSKEVSHKGPENT